MQFQKVVFLLCLYCVLGQEILDQSNRYCQKRCELKTHIEELFRIHLNKLDNQRQKICKISDMQINSMDKMTTLINKLGKMEAELLVQKAISLNLTLMVDDLLSKQDEQRNVSLEDELKQKLDSMDQKLTSMSKQQEQQSKILLRIGCPVENGYIFNPQWNICYKIFPTPVTTTGIAMKNKCSADGAEWLKITSQAMQDYIARALAKIQVSSYYLVLIQGNDEANEGRWVYDDGSPVTYFNWYPGQPDGGTRKNVIAMYSFFNFDWFDYGLHSTSTFICVCQIPIG